MTARRFPPWQRDFRALAEGVEREGNHAADE